LVEHRSHKFVFLQQAAQRSRTRVKSSLGKLLDRVQNLEDDKNLCETHEERISNTKISIQESISQITRTIVSQLQDREKKLLEEVENICEKKHKDIVARQEKLKVALKSIGECDAFVNRSFCSGDADFLALDNVLSGRIDELLSLQTSPPLSEEELSVCLELEEQQLEKEVQKFGRVYPLVDLPESLSLSSSLSSSSSCCDSSGKTVEEEEEEICEENTEQSCSGTWQRILFYLVVVVFVLCHCLPVFVATSKFFTEEI